jgi:ribose transport system substrate-binding protein
MVSVLLIAGVLISPVAPVAAQAPTDLKYAVIPPVVHPFYGPFPGAIADAEKNLGTGKIEYQLPQNFVQNEQNVIIEGLVAKGYNALSIQPADPVAGNAEITKLVDNGILVVAFGGCPTPPSKAPFCISTNMQNAAYEGAKNLIAALGGKGNIVHLTGQVADINSKLRMDGVQKAVDENPGIKLIQTIGDIDTAETAQNGVSSLFAAKRSQIDGIVCTAYNPSVAVANQMRDLNDTRIKVVAIDTDPIVLKAIEDGFVTGTMAQNPYGMAYIPIYSLTLMAKGYTWKKDAPFLMDSGSFFIGKDNLANQGQAAKALNDKLIAGWVQNWDAPK